MKRRFALSGAKGVDREQAAKIHKHLLGAVRAINCAVEAMLDLGAEARKTFDEPLAMQLKP
jgi:hypothetical protein